MVFVTIFNARLIPFQTESVAKEASALVWFNFKVSWASGVASGDFPSTRNNPAFTLVDGNKTPRRLLRIGFFSKSNNTKYRFFLGDRYYDLTKLQALSFRTHAKDTMTLHIYLSSEKVKTGQGTFGALVKVDSGWGNVSLRVQDILPEGTGVKGLTWADIRSGILSINIFSQKNTYLEIDDLLLIGVRPGDL